MSTGLLVSRLWISIGFETSELEVPAGMSPQRCSMLRIWQYSKGPRGPLQRSFLYGSDTMHPPAQDHCNHENIFWPSEPRSCSHCRSKPHASHGGLLREVRGWAHVLAGNPNYTLLGLERFRPVFFLRMKTRSAET